MIFVSEEEFVGYPTGTVFNLYKLTRMFVDGKETVERNAVNVMLVKEGNVKVKKGEAPRFHCQQFNVNTGKDEDVYIQRRYDSDVWEIGVMDINDLRAAWRSVHGMISNEVYEEQKQCLTPGANYKTKIFTASNKVTLEMSLPSGNFQFPVGENAAKKLDNYLHEGMELFLSGYFN